ncbi:MAG: hypothetical protein HFH62_01940 [Lachnospiraceae bacterium]|nr:hypothetical protein [Lachnospiraceae bacterium]
MKKIFDKYQRELDFLERGKGKFAWDELEELITEEFEEDRLSSQEFDDLMRRLMDIECG